MDIKEIALKIAEEMPSGFLWYEGCGHEAGILVEEVAEFAEALVAEIAKQNEPVVTLKSDDFGWGIWEDNLEHKPAGSILNLYTFPPTAEQIANETAKAIAEYCRNQDHHCLSAEIESGEWKEFKK